MNAPREKPVIVGYAAAAWRLLGWLRDSSESMAMADAVGSSILVWDSFRWHHPLPSCTPIQPHKNINQPPISLALSRAHQEVVSPRCIPPTQPGCMIRRQDVSEDENPVKHNPATLAVFLPCLEDHRRRLSDGLLPSPRVVGGGRPPVPQSFYAGGTALSPSDLHVRPSLQAPSRALAERRPRFEGSPGPAEISSSVYPISPCAPGAAQFRRNKGRAVSGATEKPGFNILFSVLCRTYGGLRGKRGKLVVDYVCERSTRLRHSAGLVPQSDCTAA